MASCNCGASWTGLKIEHCDQCHESFTGTSSGDRHRVGEHHIFVGPNRRRCLSRTEMLAKGMTPNARGVWTNGGTSPWAKARCSCGCPDDMHIGEIGCPCALPGEPPCQPSGSVA